MYHIWHLSGISHTLSAPLWYITHPQRTPLAHHTPSAHPSGTSHTLSKPLAYHTLSNPLAYHTPSANPWHITHPQQTLSNPLEYHTLSANPWHITHPQQTPGISHTLSAPSGTCVKCVTIARHSVTDVR
jgi:hypothetical protein